MFQSFIARETAYFYKLHQDARKLLVSIFLYNLVSPLFGIFLNAFLWRQTHDIILLTVYNLILYAFIPIGFYLNGWLLRRFSPAVPYTISLLLYGFAIAVLMFLSKISYPAIVIFSI